MTIRVAKKAADRESKSTSKAVVRLMMRYYVRKHSALVAHVFFLGSFLPRDAAQSAVLRWQVVCLSVRPSVCPSVGL